MTESVQNKHTIGQLTSLYAPLTVTSSSLSLTDYDVHVHVHYLLTCTCHSLHYLYAQQCLCHLHLVFPATFYLFPTSCHSNQVPRPFIHVHTNQVVDHVVFIVHSVVWVYFPMLFFPHVIFQCRRITKHTFTV